MKNLRTVLTSVLTVALLCSVISRMSANPAGIDPPATSSLPAAVQKPGSFVTNDVEVTHLQVEAGIFGKLWSTGNPVRATIRNNGTVIKSNIDVSLQIAGANTFNSTQQITSLAPGESEELVFQTTAGNSGTQQISVSVASDDDNNNNLKSVSQQIDCSSFRYGIANNTTVEAGTGGSAGILAVKYPVPDVPVRVDAITVKLSNNSSSIGESIYAVLLDEWGEIITSSDPVTITSQMAGNEYVFHFEAMITFQPGEKFYAGIAQETGFHQPVASAPMPGAIAERMYIFPLSGSTGTEYSGSDQWLIGVKCTPVAELVSTAVGQIMDGTQVWFIGSEGFENYTFKVNGQVKYSGTDNFMFYYPVNGDDVSLEVTKNGCTHAVPDHVQIEVIPIKSSTSNILFVNKHNAEPGDGSSWNNALTELSDALRWAKVREANFSSGNPLKIFVAGGVYKPLYSAVDETFGMDGGANNAFLLPKNVQLYGGFQGNETSPEERILNSNLNQTYLSGDYSDDDEISGSGSTLSITNTEENALHVVIASGDVGVALLDGFRIKGGGGYTPGMPFETVNGNAISVKSGGAIYLHSASPKISNLLIFHNKATEYGAGIYVENSAAIFTNLLVWRNQAGISGGGIYNGNNSSTYLTNLTITGNRAAVSGGGISNAGASPKIRNTISSGNSSGITSTNSTPQITYSLIQGLSADVSNHNLDGGADPIFTDTNTGNLTLRPFSPAVNKGSNSFYQAGQTPDLTNITRDLNGRERIQENTVDMGAYEANPTLLLLQPPQNSNSCIGTDASMSVVISSSGATPPAFQWQQSADGINWANINGAKQQDYLFKTAATLYFRCIISIPGYSIQTDAALLTAIAVKKPAINIAEKICIDEKIVALKGNPAGGWFAGQGVTGSSWNLNGLKPGKQVLRYFLLDENGCEGEAVKTIELLNCGEGNLIKSFSGYPNPTKGLAKVKVMVGEPLEAQLQVNAGDGLPVFRKTVQLSRGLNQLEVDLSSFADGLYFISIYQEPKKPLLMLRMVKQ